MFQPDKLADLISEDRRAGPKPYTLEHLAEWIATQPSEKEYCYSLSGECLLHQYGASLGLSGDTVGSVWFQTSRRLERASGIDVDLVIGAGLGFYGKDGARTFGAALERTRAAIKASRA